MSREGGGGDKASRFDAGTGLRQVLVYYAAASLPPATLFTLLVHSAAV